MKKRKQQKRNFNDIFLKIADVVSWGMGTPINIGVWIILVVSWILLFAFQPQLQNTSFLPSWFTSNAFNFPLNTVTTLAELYIGFLVGASANRNERHNENLVDKQDKVLDILLKEQKKEIKEEDQILKLLKEIKEELKEINKGNKTTIHDYI